MTTCSKCKKRKTCIDMCLPVRRYVEHRDRVSVRALPLFGFAIDSVISTVPDYNIDNKYLKTVDYKITKKSMKIVRLYNSGLTLAQIGEKLGVSKQMVHKKMVRIKRDIFLNCSIKGLSGR